MATGSNDLSAKVGGQRRLLQVCNVGRIVGGTAACAWSVTRALPNFQHHVLFLSPPDQETINVFAPVPVSSSSWLMPYDVEQLRPDAILLHNTAAARLTGELSASSVMYLHSAIAQPARADVTVCCSQWLARQVGMSSTQVLWQGADTGDLDQSNRKLPLQSFDDGRVDDDSPPLPNPLPRNGGEGTWKRAPVARRRLIVGRICTPSARKWPKCIVPFYAELAQRCPDVDWEFVGCPTALQEELSAVCGDQVRFQPAGWQQRALFTEWDVLLYSNPQVTESFGRTAAEAMLAGCVPVVDRRGGFVEQIPSDCGFLCDTIDDFTAALHQLRDNQVHQSILQHARRHAEMWFSLPRFGMNLLSLFADAAEKFPAANRCRGNCS